MCAFIAMCNLWGSGVSLVIVVVRLFTGFEEWLPIQRAVRVDWAA